MTPLGKRGGSHLTVSSTTSLSSKSVILWAVMLVSGEGAMGGASRLQVVLLGTSGALQNSSRIPPRFGCNSGSTFVKDNTLSMQYMQIVVTIDCMHITLKQVYRSYFYI